MKRIVSLLLIAVIVIGLVACGNSEEATQTTQAATQATTEGTVAATTEAMEASEEALNVLAEGSGFRVGFARVDITPTKSVPLGGFGGTRYSTTVLRRIYASCTAVADDNDNLVIFVAMDLLRNEKLMPSRDIVAQLLGIPNHHVIYNCSHTHAAPDTVNQSSENLFEWLEIMQLDVIEACMEAVKDLKPATMSYGSIETENMAFIKHYQHTTADGTVKYFGDNFGTAVYDSTTKHITEIDPTMHIIEFQRADEKPVLIANFRGHPLFEGASSRTEISSDYPGTFREAVELQYDCHFMFFQGAEGNNNCKTRLAQESRTSDAAEYGAILADYTFECLENNMTPVTDYTIQTRTTAFEGECNHDTDSLYFKAKEVQAVWNPDTKNHNDVHAVGDPYGIRSIYHAGAIVARFNRGKSITYELNAIAIGDQVSFVTAPNEMFDALSVATEEGSPYAMTMSLNLTNGYTGYIPSLRGWEYTSYESDCSWFVPGTGEKMVECHLSMLKDMAGQ